MKKVRISWYLSIALFASCADSNPQKQVKPEQAVSYVWEKEWPQLPDGYVLGNPTGIGIDSAQNIFVFHRAGRQWVEPFPDSAISTNTIIMLDRKTGKILNSWGANMFIMPHGLTVDKDNNIWVTDVGLHQVFKFSHEGKLLMTLGKAKVPGDDSVHFNLPTDVAVAADGSFYVSDGYGNSRVVKFSASGKYLLEWGKKGSQPGEFNIPHAISLDGKGNVYVADRENSRIQMFNANGKYISEWDNNDTGKIYSVTVAGMKDELMAVDYFMQGDSVPKGSDILVFDSLNGIPKRIGKSGEYDGPLCRYHDLAVDREGNIYLGDIFQHSIQKFSKGVDLSGDK